VAGRSFSVPIEKMNQSTAVAESPGVAKVPFRGGDAHEYRLESRTDSEQKHTVESSATPSSH